MYCIKRVSNTHFKCVVTALAGAHVSSVVNGVSNTHFTNVLAAWEVEQPVDMLDVL